MDLAIALPTAAFTASQITVTTAFSRQFIDLTDHIADAVVSAGVESGMVVVASRHTTAAIVVNEHEPELLKDLDRTLQALAPESAAYSHNAVPCGPEEQPNGHAHCQALFLSASASLPIVNGHIALGRYQRIFLVELDHARVRTVNVLVMGNNHAA